MWKKLSWTRSIVKCGQSSKTWRTKIKACKKCLMKEKEEQEELHQQMQCKLQDMEAELKAVQQEKQEALRWRS